MKLPLVLASTALVLSGCAIAPDPVAVAPPVPPSWPAGEAYLPQDQPAPLQVTYRSVFADPGLQALIEAALANNRDVRIAAANLAAARAQVRLVGSAQLPEIGAAASAGFQARDDRQSYALQAGIAGFELDLFGRLANATAAERERALATQEAARTVRLGLVADLADAWATYAADRELQLIAADTAANARRAVELTQARLAGGIAPRTDLRQAEQVLATAQGDLAALTALIAQDENLIRLLVGGPFDLALLPAGLEPVVSSIATVPAGTDSAILLRRPDIAAAEFRLRAASADIAVARAELFPRISLSALAGLVGSSIGTLFGGDALGLGVGADAAYAIFDGGGRRANVAVNQAQRDAALAAYEQSIQGAFREVADALAVQGTIGGRLAAARQATAAAADTAQLTESRYRGGIDSFLANLDAQRSLYAARQREIAVILSDVRNRITLYRALGADDPAPQAF